jgi:hypothetical protein
LENSIISKIHPKSRAYPHIEILLFVQLICLTPEISLSEEFSSSDFNYDVNISLSYGKMFLSPSIISYSDFNYNSEKYYIDNHVKIDMDISKHLNYRFSLELTDQSHQMIGTNYSRPDYFFSTGRIQESLVVYKRDNISIQGGRGNFFNTTYRSEVFPLPINGDGISWEAKNNNWSFKHTLSILPTEKGFDGPIRRSLSYHHLAYSHGNYVIGAGEYFILTGKYLGLEMKRLNPFLPYVLNSHDSESDRISGYFGDVDNAIIHFFLRWHNKTTTLNGKVYIDEYQIDKIDRKIYSDAILFHFNVVTNTNYSNWLGNNYIFEAGLSIANPNFGDHPGPFTSALSGKYPLFEFSPGLQRLAIIKIQAEISNSISFSLVANGENWVEISSLPSDRRNLISDISSLKVINDYKLGTSLIYDIKKIRSKFICESWYSTYFNNANGLRITILYYGLGKSDG